MMCNIGKALMALSVTLVCSSAMAMNKLDSANGAVFYKTIDDFSASAVSNAGKVDALSVTLLGAEYIGGSVGEGEQGKYDKDPLTRFDVFDCTTYVETVLAGAISTTSDEFQSNLQSIRYRNSNVDFVSRNHFPSVDWIRNNQDKLMDITPDVGHGQALVAKAMIDKSAWYQRLTSEVLKCDTDSSSECLTLLNQLREEGRIYSAEPAYIPYVPLTALFGGNTNKVDQALLDRIPSGSVISMVRPNWDVKKYIGTNMNVSHQGLAIRKNGILFLRHASLTNKKVMDENFAEYFSHYSEASSLKGFNVQVLRR
ncbi:N-acetylmuramoyl-L-alanine amidase-like domain-containing protein [Marinomonas foliarum]|uniref:DUF1460 domain-containing protein n=1 Tax=Marinomonas foliarum TaxID=491950 RepID=A0ABX7IMQ5_9GAMM|nr:N-acetylmuramoyl-L-alanine amidase-like domain-containing protein [Marinomonas foliarum]QRV23286.1 DUF1460 domain-containing protein [Marinomonas foliarum]